MPRLLAALFDRILLCAIGTVPEGWGLVDVAGPMPLDRWNRGWAVWGVTVLLASVPVVVPGEALVGKSFGKAITGIRVVRPDDGPLGWGRALGRWGLLWALPAVLVALGSPLWVVAGLLLASAAVSVTDPNGRALHDLMVGSVVTRSARSPLLRGSDAVRGLGVFERA